MPESPEVNALAGFLSERMTGRRLASVEVIDRRALKTRPMRDLTGARADGVDRHGKYVDVRTAAGHIVVGLGRHGWITVGAHRGRGSGDPICRLVLDDGTLITLVDSGSFRSAALWTVADPGLVDAVAALGPDPLDAGFARAEFDRAVRGRRKQIKAILQEQRSFAGIGNAYSDEILHAARIEPTRHAGSLDESDLDRLHDALVRTLRESATQRWGVPVDRLKAAKSAAMCVHGRSGEPCPVCGSAIVDILFAGTSAQLCPRCQPRGGLRP